MSEFLQRLEDEIHNRRLLLSGQKILAGVSGGLDSVTLLHALQQLAGKWRWKIVVAHFNHQLRGRNSDADEKLVRKTAAALTLPFVGGRADVKQFARESKLSIEMAARKLRHNFFARTAGDRKISSIALAHHADDQVELFFLRVLRGAGGEGLAGMKWLSPSPVNPKISLVRPFLNFSKFEILALARENEICFREDATNASPDFLRNRIRSELLPLLKKNYQPGVAKTVLRLMEIIGAETEFAGEAAESWLGVSGSEPASVKCQSRFKPRGTIIKENFAGLSIAVQRKVLQRQLMDFGITCDFELVERLRLSPETWVSANSKFSVGRDAAGKVGLRLETTREFNLNQVKIKLRDASRQVEFGKREFLWQIRRQKKFVRPQNPAGREIFDADKIGHQIVLRHWRAGDRFQPIGLKSAVKLQDLFVNAKIPMASRRDLVLAATVAGEVFWVEGLRIGEHFKLTPETRRQLVWNWPNLADEFALQPAGE